MLFLIVATLMPARAITAELCVSAARFTAQSSTESSDHLYIWRQIFHLLPRLIGNMNDTAEGALSFELG